MPYKMTKRGSLDNEITNEFFCDTPEDLTKIATIMIANINKRLTKTGLEIKMTARALEYIVHKGTNLNYGARPLKRYIQQEVEDRIAEKMLLGEISQTGSVVIDCVNGELVFRSI